MTLAIDAVFTKAVEQLNRESRRLNFMQRAPQATATFDHDGYSAISRALSYVVMGGVLEQLMRDLPAALGADVVSLNIKRRDLPISFIAAIEATAFRQCSADTVSALIARTSLLRDALSHPTDSRPVIDFGELFRLADGHTIGDKHFQALWSLLGLVGDWRNEANDSFLLKEIKDKRNDVAHWTEDPVVIGRSKRPSDLQHMIERLINLVDHFQLSIWLWLDECTSV